MRHTTKHLLRVGLAVAATLVAACDRSVTALQLGPAGADPYSVTEGQVEGSTRDTGAGAIMPVLGSRMELAARPGSPADCSLHVPAGALDRPAFFQQPHESAGAEVAGHVIARSTELGVAPQAPGGGAILLTLTSTGPEGTQAVTVKFSPPDGSETVVARAALRAGHATVLAFRRGRSKYSVIIF